MLNDLQENVRQNTMVIDQMISKYLANRLGVNDVQTINALGTKGHLSLKEKFGLFSDLMNMSKIDRAKFKVYNKINEEVLLQNDLLSSNNYFSNLNCYHPFLFNTYLLEKDVLSIKEKLKFAIEQLIDDVVKLTAHYIDKPKVYYNKKVGVLLPE